MMERQTSAGGSFGSENNCYKTKKHDLCKSLEVYEFCVLQTSNRKVPYDISCYEVMTFAQIYHASFTAIRADNSE